MSTAGTSLDPILRPSSIAVIGASRAAGTIGNQVVSNLIRFGFTGAVQPVNPSAAAVCSIACVPSVADMDTAPDLAVIAVPKHLVPGVARTCADAGVGGLVVISAGFREVGDDGAALERELLAIVRSNGMRMVGPNCMGVLNTDPAVSMNATFADMMPPRGNFAFMSQSGALGLSVLDYAQEYGIGISQFVSVGNKPDVSGNDLLLQWENDPSVGVILMYVENFGNPTRFLEIASRVTRSKPIVALKSGRSQIGARAAASHTGALAASDRAIDALLSQAGVLRAYSMEELFDVAIAFSSKTLPASRRTAVLTNSGGPGILAADAMVAYHLELPELHEATVDSLSKVLPSEASLRNPLDMIASAQPASYRVALETLLTDPSIDAAVAIFVPPMGVSQQDVAEAVVAATSIQKTKPVVAVLMGRNGLPQGRAELRDAGIPAYIFPESAARGLSALNRYREWVNKPPSSVPGPNNAPPAARIIIDHAVRNGTTMLPQDAALDLLQAYGLRVGRALPARDAESALVAAASLGYPVALKLVSPDITHKTDVGGVRLHLRTDGDVREAFGRIVADARNARPDARIEGVLVQSMYEGGLETIVGASRDPQFGPLIMFGLGGVMVEAMEDVTFRVAPISTTDADYMVDGIKGRVLLNGFRGRPPVDKVAISRAILAVAQIMMDLPEVVEVDINPLTVDASGAIALDARVRLAVASSEPVRAS